MTRVQTSDDANPRVREAMPADAATRPSQVDSNYEAFKLKLPELMASHPGKTVLLHDGEVTEVCDSYADAFRLGVAKYGSVDRFSVQEVTDRTISLGIYSHVRGLH